MLYKTKKCVAEIITTIPPNNQKDFVRQLNPSILSLRRLHTFSSSCEWLKGLPQGFIFSSFHCTYTTTIRVTCFLSPCRLISLSSSHLKLCIRFFKKSLATLRNLVRQQGSKILFSYSLFLVLHVFLKLSGITDSTKNIVRSNLHSVVGSVLF